MISVGLLCEIPSGCCFLFQVLTLQNCCFPDLFQVSQHLYVHFCRKLNEFLTIVCTYICTYNIPCHIMKKHYIKMLTSNYIVNMFIISRNNFPYFRFIMLQLKDDGFSYNFEFLSRKPIKSHHLKCMFKFVTRLLPYGSWFILVNHEAYHAWYLVSSLGDRN